MRVADVASHSPATLRKAAALARSSRHPLAAALAREAPGLISFEGVVEKPGEGIRAMVDGREARLGSLSFCGVEDTPVTDPTTSLIAFRHGEEIAIFAIRQALRPDAGEVVRRLRAHGLECRILSGDRPEAVAPIAAALGIDLWKASARPADKIAALEVLTAEGRKVLMVGDGLNDAPALAAAHVSISPVSAGDLVQAEADAVFLGERLAPVADAVEISRGGRSRMTENLVFSVVYNLFAVPLAIFGLVTPLIAALAMSGSSLCVTLNALRARSGHGAASAGEGRRS
jgi:Cu2+-exporting ATPase